MNLVPSRPGSHTKFWTKENFLKDLESFDIGIRKICFLYADASKSEGKEVSWRHFYNDIWRWKKTDPEFAKAYQDYLSKIGAKSQGGRPSLEITNPDWKEKFCKDLIELDGDRAKAADRSPYTFSSILHKLNPADSEYDKDFSDMVRTTELRISAIAEAMLVGSLRRGWGDPDHLPDRDTALILETQARISERIVSKLDPDRWGKKVDLRHSGEIQHSHQHQIEIKATKIESLMEEQRLFLTRKGQNLPIAIPEKTETSEDIIEAEFEPIAQEKVVQAERIEPDKKRSRGRRREFDKERGFLSPE